MALDVSSELVGYVAATLTTASFVPQVWHSLRSRNFAGLSLRMYGMFAGGVALWLVYGLMIRQWPIVIANAVTLALAGTILVMALRSRAGTR
ncbi:MAG: SemiSWEET transporter [Burkholderiaceae bacterium]